jgi:hypothetical protein
MSADIVNLRQARKRRARDIADREAEANRIAFGRTKAERTLRDTEKTIAERRIEGHRLDKDES